MSPALMLLLMRMGPGEEGVVVAGPFRSVAGQAWSAGSDRAQAWNPGSVAAQNHTAGSEKGQFV